MNNFIKGFGLALILSSLSLSLASCNINSSNDNPNTGSIEVTPTTNKPIEGEGSKPTANPSEGNKTSYDVEVNYDNGSDKLVVKYNKGDKLSLDIPKKDGYVFAGWVNSDGSKVKRDSVVNSNLKITAKWVVKDAAFKDYDIEILDNGYLRIIEYFGHDNSIIIPDGTNIIGSEAFINRNGLASVTFPSSLKAIEDRAFACAGFENIVIPNSVVSIGSEAFQACFNLKSITIPSSVTRIGESILGACDKLERIEVDSNNPLYNSKEGCNAIIETKTGKLIQGCNNTIINNKVKAIATGSFYGCRKMTNLRIPSSVVSIEERAFNACVSIENIEVDSNNTVYYSPNNSNAIIARATDELIQGFNTTIIPNNVKSIGPWAFANLDKIATINIPDSVIAIKDYAFISCHNLTDLIIPSSVEAIGKSAFESCSLKNIKIPSTLTKIGTSAFGYNNLSKIEVDSNNLVYDSRNNCNAIIETKTNKLIQGSNGTIIPTGITSIADFAFAGINEIAQILLPSSIASIGDGAFIGCMGLKSITIPTGVKVIGDNAFSYCVELRNIDISSSVSSIGKRAFFLCNNLSNINIDTNNLVYDSRNNSNAIIETKTNKLILGSTNTTIPEGVEIIGEEAFYGLYDLKNITIPSSVRIIERSAFEGCRALESIVLTMNVEQIGRKAFKNCDSLTIRSGYTSKPVGWDEFWNPDNRVVKWRNAKH